MALERIANEAQSTLSDPIDDVVGVLDVIAPASFPVDSQFRIRIEDELLLVTGVSGTTFTVTRGVEGTTAVPHDSGVPVTHVLTAAALIQLIKDQNITGVDNGLGTFVAHVTATEVRNESTVNGLSASREDQIQTTDASDTVLLTVDLSASPDVGVIVDVCVVGIATGAAAMHWYKKSIGCLNTAAALNLGTQRDVDDELIGGPPAGTWNVFFSTDGVQSITLSVNGDNDNVTWYVVSQSVRVVPL